MIIDPIADMISIIKNGINIKTDFVFAPKSKIKMAILKILKKNGYISGFDIEKKNDKEKIKINLKYIASRPAITQIKRLSKPGRRLYRSFANLPRSLNGLGMIVVSTSNGVLSDKEARLKHLGGEIICEIN